MPTQANKSTQATTLTTDQQDQLQTLLSEFDVDNLSADDATKIVSSIQEMGIEPSQSLTDLMADSGFDAQAIGDMGGANRPPPPPPPQESTTTESSELVSFLEELLESYDSEELSDENKDSILAAVQEKFGLTATDSMISVQV